VVNVGIINDLLVEGDETFGFFLTGGPANVDLSGQTNATITIQDDEKAIQFGQTNYIVSEAGTNAAITLTRIGGQSGTISATFATADGTATAPGDYTSVSTNVSFAPGQTNAIIFVPIIDDSIGEPAETVLLRL